MDGAAPQPGHKRTAMEDTADAKSDRPQPLFMREEPKTWHDINKKTDLK